MQIFLPTWTCHAGQADLMRLKDFLWLLYCKQAELKSFKITRSLEQIKKGKTSPKNEMAL
jgi:hypothetical protein